MEGEKLGFSYTNVDKQLGVFLPVFMARGFNGSKSGKRYCSYRIPHWNLLTENNISEQYFFNPGCITF